MAQCSQAERPGAEHAKKERLHTPTEKRGFVTSKFWAVVHLHGVPTHKLWAGFMGGVRLSVRLAARLFPRVQHPVHPLVLNTLARGFKSQRGATT